MTFFAIVSKKRHACPGSPAPRAAVSAGVHCLPSLDWGFCPLRGAVIAAVVDLDWLGLTRSDGSPAADVAGRRAS